LTSCLLTFEKATNNSSCVKIIIKNITQSNNTFLCILTLITIALSIRFTIKHRLFARKKRLANRNEATLISLWNQERAISADIRREYHPLHLVWWALISAIKWQSVLLVEDVSGENHKVVLTSIHHGKIIVLLFLNNDFFL
jgi:hypothetical protein